MNNRNRVRSTLLFVAALLSAGLGGCGTPIDALNPEFLNLLGFGRRVATLPGEAPAVVVAVENRVSNIVETRLTWRDRDGQVQERINVLVPNAKHAEAVICPVEEVTLGQIADLRATGAIVRLGNQTENDPIVEIEPFGFLLQEGVNFDCGDSVLFRILSSRETKSGYRIFAYIQRAGAQSETLIATSDTGTTTNP